MARVKFTTPVGIARFPKLTEPDTQGEYADNKYKTDLILTDGELKEVKKTIVAFAKENLPGCEKPDLPIKSHRDKETGEVTWFLRFKSKRRPVIIDANRNRVPQGVEIGGGSKIRVGGTLNAYEKGGNKGVNIYLNAVQVIQLQEGGFNRDDFDDYTGDDAYVAEAVGSEGDGDESEFDL